MNIHSLLSLDLEEEVPEQLCLIGTNILNNACLVIKGKEFEIIDIEVLYHKPGVHEDPWLHSDYAQLQSLTWYFHGSSPKRYCLDLTFGDKATNTFASILIRKIKAIDGTLELDGPSEIVNEILQKFHATDWKDLLSKMDKGAIKSVNPDLYIKMKANLNPKKIFSLPRFRDFDESDNWKDPRFTKFYLSPYRFTTYLDNQDPSKYLIHAWNKFHGDESLSLKFLEINDSIFAKHQDTINKGKILSLGEIVLIKSPIESKLLLFGHCIANSP